MQKPYQTSRAALSDLASNMNYITGPILSPVKDTFLKCDSPSNLTPTTISTTPILHNRLPSAPDPPALTSADIEQLKKIDLSYLTLFRKSSKFSNKGFNHFFLSQELDYTDHTFDTDSDISSDARVLSPSRSDEASVAISTDSHALYAMAFNSDGKYLATAGADGLIKIWEVITSETDRMSDNYQSTNTNGSYINVENLARNGSTKSNYLLTPHSHRKSFIDSLDESYSKSSQKRSSISRTRKNTINSFESNHDKNSKSNIYAPLFKQKPVKTFFHDKPINSLDWSKNNFLLSSSEDGLVKLWHVNRADCLQTYKFDSVVTCAKFHTLDDRFFFTTQWNGKLTFLSVLEKEIVYEIDLKRQLTCLELSPKSELVFIGCDKGYMFSVKVDKGFVIEADYQYKKHTPRITGIQIMGDDISNLKVLISATDSKIRLVNYSGRFLEMVYSGHTVKASNIIATKNENNSHVITGSEDGWVYIWETYSNRKDKVDRERKKRLFNKSNLNLLKFFRDDDSGIAENKSYGSFHTNQSKCNVALFAPRATMKLLELSNDPIFDLKHSYSYLMNKEGIKDYEVDDLSTAVIITADSTGKIKVFRRDSAYYIRKALTGKKIGQILESRRNSASSESIVPSFDESQSSRGRSSGNQRVSGRTAYEALTAGSLPSVPIIKTIDDISAPLGSSRTITSSYPSENGTFKQQRQIGSSAYTVSNNIDDILPSSENIDDEIRKLIINSKEEQVVEQNQHSSSNSMTKIGTLEDSDLPQSENEDTLKCSNCDSSDFVTRPMDTAQTNEIKFYCNDCGQVSDHI